MALKLIFSYRENPEKFWDDRAWADYGFALSYGIGFGYPHLTAQALPSSKVGCGLEDYYSVLDDFNIRNGPKELLEALDVKEDVKSILTEAGAEMKIAMNCLDPDRNIQSFRVQEGLKLLMLAMEIRVDVD